MKTLIFITLTLFSWLSINGQGLELIRNNKSKILKEGRFVELHLAKNFNDPDCDFCSSAYVLGSVQKVEDGYIFIDLTSKVISKCEGGKTIAKEDNYINIVYVEKFALEDVYYIKDYKTQKNKNKKETFMGVGGLLIITGIASGITTLLSSDKKAGWIFTGSQFAIGTTFLILSGNKKYDLRKEAHGYWEMKY